MSRIEPASAYKILVVEDEGLIAEDIANRLEAMGHEVAGTASTAEEAIDQASAADIVLMDIHIDGQRDGIEAATEIRARHRLPVVFLTAHADRSTLERAKLAGPFGYIVKPLGPASLQTGIEIAIARHGVERSLEEREVWLRQTIACLADGVVVTSAEARVRLLNRAAERLTGWTQAEAEGQPVSQVVRLMDTESSEDDPGYISVALLRDAPVDLPSHCRLLSRDGREMEIEGSVAPVRVSQDLLGAVMTFRDASARHWEERQLRQAQRLEAAGRLAAGAANEYTTAIAMIRKQTEHLLVRFGEYSPARSALEEIYQSAAAAERITRRLAMFGTRQAGQPETLSVNSLLRRMLRLIESTAGDRIQVALRPSPKAGRIRADLTQMESTVMNLVTHACSTIAKQGREGGQILIETNYVELPHASRSEAYALLAVTYSGLEPDIECLFDPAPTADSGLELAMVHSVASECGGYVSARSGPNRGSCIELLLPRVSDQALLPETQETAGAAATVLLVDGRSPVRAELHNFFEAAGYNLLEAADAREAVAIGEMHDGSLDVVVAEACQSSSILQNLRAAHPSLQALRIVEQPEPGPGEIRRPFTRQALLDRVSAVFAGSRAELAGSGDPARTRRSALLLLRWRLDLRRRSVGNREDTVGEVLVDQHGVGENLVNLLPVAVAGDLLRPLHAAHLLVTRESRNLFVAFLGFGIAPNPYLLHRELGDVVKVSRDHAVLRIRDVHDLYRLVLHHVGAAGLEDQARLMQPHTQEVEQVVQRRVAITVEAVLVNFLVAVIVHFPTFIPAEQNVSGFFVLAERLAFPHAQILARLSLGYGQVARVDLRDGKSANLIAVKRVGAAGFDAVLHGQEFLSAQRGHRVVDHLLTPDLNACERDGGRLRRREHREQQ